MKKFGFGLLLVGAVLMLSGAAFALQPISDSQMASITAQSGVDIAVDDVVIYQHFNNLSYTDNDGTGTLTIPGTPATVNLADFGMTTYINAIAYDNTTTGAWISLGGNMGLMGSTASATYNPGADFAQALTIDVGTMPILSAGYSLVLAGSTDYATTGVFMTGVKIGIPTLEIYVPSLEVTPSVTETTAINSYNVSTGTGAEFGTIGITGMTTAFMGGHLEIAPH